MTKPHDRFEAHRSTWIDPTCWIVICRDLVIDAPGQGGNAIVVRAYYGSRAEARATALAAQLNTDLRKDYHG